jgi:isoleucyl-tRNA synthetase
MTVALNTVITEELQQEGIVREVIRAIQDYRKKMDLPIEKRVNLVLDIDSTMIEAMDRFENVLYENVLLSSIKYDKKANMETVQIEDKMVGLLIE